jgi:hypothetical protein
VPGVFVYTANGTEINAASYLAIGTYTLSATFYPDRQHRLHNRYGSRRNLRVTKAPTTAAVGTTQNLVASDGTGNFTSVQSAINALPATGGSIYIKPGTYTGFLTVVQPNVALRGLGGDPTQVILTHEAGAFSSTPIQLHRRVHRGQHEQRRSIPVWKHSLDRRCGLSPPCSLPAALIRRSAARR